MSNCIQILPSLIAERIAAGEVIERPASVVKELVENSIDAGATSVQVVLSKGGTDFLEVIDNGQGMAREDLELCVCRHATSKIKVFEDLSRLSSLGFRGEALPSIASVSELTLTSRATDAGETFAVTVSQSAPTRGSSTRVANQNFLGSSHGTRIRVASLFSQVPARLKFLKSQGAEASAVREIVERLALTHPEIEFKVLSEDRTLLFLPSSSLKDRAIKMLGDNNPYEALEVTLSGSYGIHLIWLRGLSLPHTRSMYQIVNDRALRDRTLQMALLNPLKQSFLPGNFPALVAKLNVPQDEIDVNVHPTKTEIRFLHSSRIFAICDAAIQKLLDEGRQSNAYTSGFSASSSAASLAASSQPVNYFSSANASPYGYTPFLSANVNANEPGARFGAESSGGFSSASYTHYASRSSPAGTSFGSTPAPGSEAAFFHASRLGTYRGVLFSTYFVFEKGEELLLVDQHAAHERIRYEMLKKRVLNREQIETQILLVPEIVKLTADKQAAIKTKLPLLLTLGFEIEEFGEDTFLVRGIPSVWGNLNLAARLKNLFERLFETEVVSRELAWDETLFEKVAMEACRSSFKAGDHIFEEGAIDITEKLFECEHPGNCPHGRPTWIKISRNKVEEWFSRLS
jgi:DNA mismatch repair protein MutL